LEGYLVVEKGDYVYNPRISTTAPVGPISKNNVATGVMSPLYTVFRFNNCHNDFYAYYFKTTGWHQYMRQASSTGARHDRMAIANGDFMAMPLPVASSEEQQKIADCLASLDERITLEAQKLDTLKTHKKGLMQQLFPAEGETLPKLRFPEFRGAGEWDSDELGNVADFVNEKVPVEQIALENYVSTENILQDYGGVARASKLPSTGAVTRFRQNDTLVSNIRPYLKKVWVADKEGGASNDVIVIRAKQELLTQYFSFLLKNDAFIDYVMTGAKGNTV
jgi:type I restriction enzyme S subunit